MGLNQRFQEKINNNYKEENIMSHFITLVFTKENIDRFFEKSL